MMTTDDTSARGIARLIRAVRRRADPDGESTRVSVRWLTTKLPELFDRIQQQWAVMRQVQVDLESQERALGRLSRDVAWMRRAITRQRSITSNLLQRAGLHEQVAEAEQHLAERMARLTRSSLPIVVGPWTGEVGFELLYWIPFLQAMRERYAIDPDRLVVVSRGGVGSWYSHVGGRYVEAFATETPEAFREATESVKKQRSPRAFEKRLLRAALRSRGVTRAHVLHPSLMYALLWSFWNDQTPVRHVESVTSFKPLAADRALLPPGLPREYVAARFYFSDCFPDTAENRAFVQRVLAALSSRTDVVLLNTPFAVDDHRDITAGGSGRIQTIEQHMHPPTNLGVQTAIIANATAFVGTYGGYAYLAPFHGVHATSFYSRTTFRRHHLDLAHRVFERIGSARLCAIDAGAADAVEIAFGGVTEGRALPSAARS